ncbi:MAG: hypothetical protein LBL47_04600 [Lactobacillus sp.]|jgi:hypothetical protein|nr:hypothetical protein [Lactobacillus sp.]
MNKIDCPLKTNWIQGSVLLKVRFKKDITYATNQEKPSFNYGDECKFWVVLNGFHDEKHPITVTLEDAEKGHFLAFAKDVFDCYFEAEQFMAIAKRYSVEDMEFFFSSIVVPINEEEKEKFLEGVSKLPSEKQEIAKKYLL